MWIRIFSISLVCFLYSCETTNIDSNDKKTIDTCLSRNLKLSYSNISGDGKIILVSDSATVEQITTLFDTLDWTKFHLIWLEGEYGSYLELGGSLYSDGFSAVYQEYDSADSLIYEGIVKDIPNDSDYLKQLLLYAVEKRGSVKKEYFNERKKRNIS